MWLRRGMPSGILSGMPTDNDTKVRENRLRRMAQRQGFTLTKSRTRDPRAQDYQTWIIAEAPTHYHWGNVEAHGLDVDEVEAWLLEGD